jgi:hypothetical protein
VTTDRRVLVAAAICLLVIALFLRLRGARTPAVVADPVRTPGVLNAAVTQATIGATICRSGFTRTIRPPHEYTDDLKRKQLREYGFGGAPSQYQEDHLISLELGGHPTDPRNLWPESRPRAEEVDGTENDLNRRICDGSLSLRDAQREISRIKHEEG